MSRSDPSKYDAHIYVIEWGDGAVKVGFSAYPERRVAQHRANGKRFGRAINKTWISKSHHRQRAIDNEAALIKFCTSYPGALSRDCETFEGVPYSAVVAHAETLAFVATTHYEFAYIEATAERDAAGLMALMESLHGKQALVGTPVEALMKELKYFEQCCEKNDFSLAEKLGILKYIGLRHEVDISDMPSVGEIKQ